MGSYVAELLDSYFKKTFDALTESLIPTTPDLADKLGEEHRAGASQTELSLQVRQSFDNISSIRMPLVENDGDESPEPKNISPLLALVLDLGTIEFLLRGSPNEFPNPSLGGPFSWLEPDDRLNVIDFLRTESCLQVILEVTRPFLPQLSTINFVLDGLVSIPLINYYSEWPGYVDPTNLLTIDPNTGDKHVQSWEQTKFPGREPGYAILRGYEIDEFEENEYS